ncbi:hypothetical protein BCR34DRAFT_606586 [Clohesyomyces aquaticus]|uniref:Uncharacterized protein n=1 Tax=Clohesyomyces aquaticus TaxID=1231657 RepID=A0A1Y1YP71_9PLEO|nr:hypothetical protein BCR34DRAFT_606586 [Clohesyomyces aquaticus]
MTDPNSDSARREPGDARPQYQPYLPYRPPGSDFTPPASPQPMNPFAAPPAKKSFGALRSKHPANVQTGAPVQSPHERQAYSPTPSSSPPLPPLPNSPHLPSRARAPSLLRHATTSSPLSEGYPQAGQPLPSPTFSMASDGVRRPGGRGLPSNPRAMFNPLASNPVHASGPGWNGPGEDIVGNPQARQRGYTSSSQPSYAHPPLRSATSIPDYGSVRDVDRTNLSGAYRPNRGGTNWSHADPHPPFRQFRGEEPRSSMRSGWTHASSFMGTNGTERGSFATGRSSISDPRISIVSGEQTDTQSVETDQGLTGDDDDDDEYPGMDIIDSYSAADVIESYFDTDEEKEESEQHNEKDSQHERASSSYSSDPDRRTSSGTHQQDIRRASRPDIESYPSRSSRERWDSRHVSDIDSGYYPSSRSQQTHHSISPLEPQVTGDGGFPSPQDDRRISALSESQGGEKSDFTSQRQSNGLPQLPPLDIGPTRISYSSTSDQNPQVAYNSPKERRDVREQGNETRGYPSTGERHDTLHSHPSAGAIQHSVEDSNVVLGANPAVLQHNRGQRIFAFRRIGARAKLFPMGVLQVCIIQRLSGDQVILHP